MADRLKATAVLIRSSEGDQVIALPEPMLPGQVRQWVRANHGQAAYWPVMASTTTTTPSKRRRKG